MLKRLFRISRPAAMLLAWTHRRTIALWLRSIWHEFFRGRAAGHQELARWRKLMTALVRVSTDPRLIETNELRKLMVASSDVVAETPGRRVDRRALAKAGITPGPLAEPVIEAAVA
jgi:hypothetical protein